MDIPASLRKLHLPEGSYVVVGSSVLQALGLRAARDIDVCVEKTIFEQLARQPEWQAYQLNGQSLIRRQPFDIGTSWLGRDVSTLLASAFTKDGIPYVSLDLLYEWKRHYNRPGDRADRALIRKYLEHRSQQ